MAVQKEITVPDIGDFQGVEIIEILVAPGDKINKEDSLITLESDKASMEIPSPESGTVRELKVKLGDAVSEGDPILVLEAEAEEAAATTPAPQDAAPAAAVPEALQVATPATAKPLVESPAVEKPAAIAGRNKAGPRISPTAHIGDVNLAKVHASPSVRRFARELGADLTKVEGSGAKGRILKEDVQRFVKRALSTGAGGLQVAEWPEVDFSEFGEIEVQPLSKINKLTGQFLHRNWVMIPHVTHFDEADITELEDFRKALTQEYKDQGTKITILAFLMKAAVSALKTFPRFNASLDSARENLIIKHYYHIGVAVDTPQGLVVPVIRDVDRKSLVELAAELSAVSEKARAGKLTPSDMKGGCFSISSLGGIGGTAFTPIVNAPEVAILGASRATMKPVYLDGNFVPRLILPLTLSYDHRVIDGAAAARFTAFLSALLSDTRRMLL